MTVRVAVIDDQELVRGGISMLLDLQDDVEVVGQFCSGEEILDALDGGLLADVLCMDVQMPGMGGIEAVRQIRDSEFDPKPRVLMLTTFDREDYLLDSLRAGAAGFLLKNAPPEDLARAVGAIADGESLLAPEVTRTVIRHLVAADSTESPSGHPNSVPGERGLDAATAQLGAIASLSERELEVLKAMAEGLSNAEIAERLVLGRSTVKTHVSNILTKLGLRDRVQAVIAAYRAHLMS